MAHSHDHGHQHANPFGSRRYMAAAAMEAAFVVLEVIVGIQIYSSTGIIADAGHNAGDILTGMFAALVAGIAARRTHTHMRHWGGIFICTATVILIATVVGLEATTPPNNSTSTVIATALLGCMSFGVNHGIAAYLEHSHDQLAKAAAQHYRSDAKVSLILIPTAILALAWSWAMVIGAAIIVFVTVWDNWQQAAESWTELKSCRQDPVKHPQRSS